MKLTTRCGSAAVGGLNEALLAKVAVLDTEDEGIPLRFGEIQLDAAARYGPDALGPMV